MGKTGMTNIIDIRRAVLERVAPNEKEQKELDNAVSELMFLIEGALKKYSVKASPVLVGSIAKHTHNKSADIDIFLKFSPETSRGELERFGLLIGRMVLGGEERYAEHPYMHGEYKGYDTDIVPCYDIDDPSQKMSAVDRTPFHTKYIIERLPAAQRDDVRLFKQFLKGIGVYGAEISVQGFSGYLSELVVLKYGSFEEALRNCAKWKQPTFITLSRKNDEVDKQNESERGSAQTSGATAALNTPATSGKPAAPARKFDEPLVVIDPVDANRNVASALSAQNLAKFIHACQEYLACDDDERRLRFFFPRNLKPHTKTKLLSEMKKRGTTFVSVAFEPPVLVDDILYSQLRKFEKSVAASCTSEEFRCAGSSFFVFERKGAKTKSASAKSGKGTLNVQAAPKTAFFIFEFINGTLPRSKKHAGPPVSNERSMDFLAKWRGSPDTISGPHIEDDTWVVNIKREHTDVARFIESELKEMSVGKDLAPLIKAGKFKVTSSGGVVQTGTEQFLTRYLSKKFEWEI